MACGSTAFRVVEYHRQAVAGRLAQTDVAWNDPDLTVSENLYFFASLFGVRVKDNYDLIAPFFDQLAKFPGRRAGALSGGDRKSVV